MQLGTNLASNMDDGSVVESYKVVMFHENRNITINNRIRPVNNGIPGDTNTACEATYKGLA